MTNQIPNPRNPYDFTEQPDWRLEDRYQQLSEQEACGSRKEQIATEMAHILFELGMRAEQNEVIIT